MYLDFDRYKTTTIRVNKKDYEALKDIAREQDRSVNYIINKIIIEYIIINHNKG